MENDEKIKKKWKMMEKYKNENEEKIEKEKWKNEERKIKN